MNSEFTIKSKESFYMNAFDKNKESELITELNSIINATIINKQSDLTELLTTDDKKLNVPSDNIVGEIGDSVQFEVIESSKNKLNLKQINNKKEFEVSKNKKNNQNKQLFKKSDLIEQPKDFNEIIKDTIEEKQKLSSIKRKLSYCTNNVNSSAIAQLTAEGISVSKVDLTTLTNSIKNVKENQDLNFSTNEIDENTSKEDNKTKIVKALKRNDMPTTKNNVDNLDLLLEKSNDLKNLNNDQIISILKNNNTLTIQNIYKDKFSSYKEEPIANFNQNWDNISKEVEKFLLKNNLNTSNDLEISKFLIKFDLPVTTENIEKTDFLTNINSKLNYDYILNMGIKNIIEDKNIYDINIHETNSFLSQNSLQINYDKIINKLPLIKSTEVDYLIKNNIPITINNLLKNENKQIGKIKLNEEDYLKSITAQRQLLEVQLKLTTEASKNLTKSNIKIDTIPIKDALDILKSLENEKYKNSLITMGEIPTETKMKDMENIFTKVSTFNILYNNVFADAIDEKVDFNIDSIDKSIKFAKLQENYEIFETVANPKYGDSFSKVKSEFSPLLESLGLPDTDQNIKSASILSKNNIDVTEDNINEIKLIDSKIENIYNRLHPNVVSSMFKDGLNPSKMHVDDLLDYVSKFEETYGNNIGDKISSYILTIDEGKTQSKEQREAMISVYRMMNTIQKNNSVGLGLMLKNEPELTLENMLQSAKLYSYSKNNKNIDFKLDNEFGMLNDVDNSKTILSTITKYSEKVKYEYNKLLTEEFINNAQPLNFSELLNTNTNTLSNNLENIVSELKNISDKNKNMLNKLQIENEMQQINSLLETSPNIISWLETNSISSNIKNIDNMKELNKNPFILSDFLNEIKELYPTINIEDLVPSTDLKEIKNGISSSEILENLNEEIDSKIKSYITDENIKIENLKNMLLFQEKINSSSSNDFKLPIKLNDSISSLNVHILNTAINSNDYEIFMNLNTKNLGNIEFKINALNNSYLVTISGENDEITKQLENNKSDLMEILQNTNVNLNDVIIKFDIKNEIPSSLNESIPINFNYTESNFKAIV